MDLQAFELGPIWGGMVFYPLSTIDQHLKAFVDLNSADTYDEYASLITSFGFSADEGSAVVNSIEYTNPVENPPVFHALMEIPSLYSTMRISNMTDIATEQGSFLINGKRSVLSL